MSLLLAQSGHGGRDNGCLLSGVKRTSDGGPLCNFRCAHSAPVLSARITLPHFSVSYDEVAKIGRRHRFWNAADLCESRNYLWIGERRVDHVVKFIDYFCRRVLWCDQTIPNACLPRPLTGCWARYR